MTGYAFAIGNCFGCRRLFSFSPTRVPSYRDEHGERQPVCRSCVEQANPKRKANGLPPIEIMVDAYGPTPEAEL